MIIKTYKEAYEKVAEETGLEKELVYEMANFMWNEVRSSILEMKHREIYVAKLGNWTFRRGKGLRAKKSQQAYEDKVRSKYLDDIIYEEKTKDYHRRMERVEILLKEWDEIIAESNEFKSKRDGKNNGNIPQPQSNMGGVEEQSI